MLKYIKGFIIGMGIGIAILFAAHINSTTNMLISLQIQQEKRVIDINNNIATFTNKVNDNFDTIFSKVEMTRGYVDDLSQGLNIERKLTDLNQKVTTELIKKIVNLPEKIRIDKIVMEERLKQVNVFINNKTRDALGSGVTLKYKGKFYILTAGHLLDSPDDMLTLSENGKEICELEVVKVDFTRNNNTTKGTDLLLLRPKNKDIVPQIYVELSDMEPRLAEEVFIVGNTLGIEDNISEARITAYRDNYMFVKGDAYFGNSGGGLYTYNGKLVGILSFVFPALPFPDTIIKIKGKEGEESTYKLVPGIPAYVLTGVVRLETIMKFLEGVV